MNQASDRLEPPVETRQEVVAAEVLVYAAVFVGFLTLLEHTIGRWGSVTAFAVGPILLAIGALLAKAAWRRRAARDPRIRRAVGPLLFLAVLFGANGTGYLASFAWRLVDIDVWAGAHPYAPVAVAVWVLAAVAALRMQRSPATAVGLIGAILAGLYVLQTWFHLITHPASYG